MSSTGSPTDISRITERLWTGRGYGPTPTGAWLAHIQAAGITHIIDNSNPAHTPAQHLIETHAPNISYLLNPQPDNGQTPPDDWFNTGVDFALHALANPDAQVLAQCRTGIDLGPTMAFAILLATGMTPEQAQATIMGAHPTARLAYADDATNWWADLTATEIYYHGGPPGLHVGELLLPPSITGASTLVDRMPDPSNMPADWRQTYHQLENHRVFVTTDLAIAIAMASRRRANGAVYRVQPLGTIADRNWKPLSETTCDRARIVAVVMERVTPQKAIAAVRALRATKAMA